MTDKDFTLICTPPNDQHDLLLYCCSATNYQEAEVIVKEEFPDTIVMWIEQSNDHEQVLANYFETRERMH